MPSRPRHPLNTHSVYLPERERERQTDRERERDRQRDRERRTDRETDRERGIQREREREIEGQVFLSRPRRPFMCTRQVSLITYSTDISRSWSTDPRSALSACLLLNAYTSSFILLLCFCVCGGKKGGGGFYSQRKSTKKILFLDDAVDIFGER